MSQRARFYVVLGLDVVAAVMLTMAANAGDWSRLQLYGAAAALLAVLVVAGNLWIDMARDGAPRH